MTNKPLDWPPPYSIKKSLRSKRISLRISPSKGLEIIVPKRASEQKALEFLNLKYDWVQKHRHLLNTKRDLESLPESLDLKTINQVWSINFAKLPIKKTRLLADENTKNILICGEDLANPFHMIKSWLKTKAENHLLRLLQEFSQKYCLPYNDARIRFQKSLWGSCTKNKNINLNCKLLFIPLELTHYVMVHELVHTIHFDHSPKFWAAVEKIIPNYTALLSELKNIDHQLPSWLYY